MKNMDVKKGIGIIKNKMASGEVEKWKNLPVFGILHLPVDTFRIYILIYRGTPQKKCQLLLGLL